MHLRRRKGAHVHQRARRGPRAPAGIVHEIVHVRWSRGVYTVSRLSAQRAVGVWGRGKEAPSREEARLERERVPIERRSAIPAPEAAATLGRG